MNIRLYDCMNAAGMDALVVCRQDMVAYCTGFDTPCQYGASDNMVNGAFTYAFVDARSRTTTLVAADCIFSAAKAESFADEVVSFDSFDFFCDINGHESLKHCLNTIVSRLKGSKIIGIENMALPLILYKELSDLPGAELVDVLDVLNEARKIKQPYEIERLKYAAGIEDAGQLKLLEFSKNFTEETEFKIYTEVYRAMCEAHGKRVMLTGDLATGPRIRTLSGVSGPINRKIEKGDLGIFDMSIRINGYWCDCTNTVVFGCEPNPEQKRYFKMVREAFDAGFEKLVPGNRLIDVDKAMESVFNFYGKKPVVYSGHQVGCNVNEVPRIQCFSTDVIQEDMVVCLEPQNYTEDEGCSGVRLERVIHITKNGPVSLNKYPWGIDI